MYNIFWLNLGWWSPESFDVLNDALKYVYSKGFSAAIYKDDELICSYNVLGGLRYEEGMV